MKNKSLRAKKGMVAIDIIQDAARRLNIMVPQTINSSAETSSAIDYDAALLLSCLNAVIRQTAQTTKFKMATHICQTSVVNNDRFFFVSDLEEGEDACDDFIYELTDEVSDFISLLGDGITVACVLEGVEVKRVIFRQLTETDFLKLKKTPASLREVAANALFRQSTPLDPVDVKKKPLWQLRKEYKKNMPSEDRTQIVHAKNRESGFYIFSLDGINQMVYFCNNMLSRKDEENSQWMAYFLYQSNAVVFSSGLPKESISDDNDMCIFNAELLILGTVINYKGYYGLDNSLDLGQYKALKDSLEKNQENVQITHLEKKKYYEK